MRAAAVPNVTRKRLLRYGPADCPTWSVRLSITARPRASSMQTYTVPLAEMRTETGFPRLFGLFAAAVPDFFFLPGAGVPAGRGVGALASFLPVRPST